MTNDLVRLKVVSNELEAEMVRSLLSTRESNRCSGYTDFGAGAVDGMPSGGGPREILVHAGDLEAARELAGSE